MINMVWRGSKAIYCAHAFLALFLLATPAHAKSVISTEAHPLSMIVLLAALALLPFLLIMVTSFVKVAVVLSLLRSAIGVQQIPPNQIITGLAMILSIYIMAPVAGDIYAQVEPFMDAFDEQKVDQLSARQAREIAMTGVEPLRQFLQKHTDIEEQSVLYELALELQVANAMDKPIAVQPENAASDDEYPAPNITKDSLIVLIPAFVMTELKEAFIIGFILFIPFIVIDLVIANILLSLGMHMLSPTTISLPFKLLLFVLVDGWFLVIKGLILGYL